MRTLKLPVLAALAVVALVIGVLVAGAWTGSQDKPTASRPWRADPSHQRPAVMRSLAVTTTAEPAPSGHPDHMRALLLDGRLPARSTTATVLSDEDCAPDAEGVSHCRNRLRLASGKRIEVRHPHRMHEVPCMTPGERVRVHRAAGA